MRRLIILAVAGLLALAGLAGPARAGSAAAAAPAATAAAGCSTALQAANVNIGGGVLASPYMTTPASSTCGNVYVTQVTDLNWAPINVGFYARIRLASGVLGQWIYFPPSCYTCTRSITTGAWGGLRYRVEFSNTLTSVVHFYVRH